MISFISVLIKNFQIMLRSKFVIGLVILAPLVLVSLFSFGIVGTGLTNIAASFYSTEEGDYRSLFMAGLFQSSFLIQETDSREECIKRVSDGMANVCIILKDDPNGMPLPSDPDDRSIKNFKKTLGVELQVDFSKQRVVWGIINRVNGVVESFSEHIQQEVIDEISSKFDSSLNKIELLESNIKNIESSIDQNRVSLSSISNNLDSFRSSALNDIATIENTLNQVALILLPGAGFAEINQIRSSIFNLKNMIDATGTQTNSISQIESNINKVSLSLTQVKQKVASTKSDLIDLKNIMSDEGSFNLNRFIEPIPLSYSSISEETASNNSNSLNLIDYLLPSLISFFVVFTSIMFGSSLIIKERSSNAHIRNYLSKTSGFSFVLGNLSYLIIAILFQVFILLLFANFTINPSIAHNWVALLVYLGLGVSIFSVLGTVIGYTFNSRDTVILSAVCVSLIFIIFSPLVNPLETMPPLLKEIFSKSPAVMVEQGVSRVLFFEKGIEGNFGSIIILSAIFLFLFVISLLLHKLSKERLVKE